MGETDRPQPGEGQAPSYSGRIFGGGWAITRWAHRGRLATALRLLEGRRFSRATDVGCADGWFVRELLQRGVIDAGVGLDTDPSMLDACRGWAHAYPSLAFFQPDPQTLESLSGASDLVVCLETLEHVEKMTEVAEHLARLARPGGTVLVSVPIELGPSLLVKQTGRWIANRRGEYGYERYSARELVQAGLLGRLTGIHRRDTFSHKGFDYRSARKALDPHIAIERSTYSPVHVFGPVLATTVYWIGRRRDGQKPGHVDDRRMRGGAVG